MRSFSSLSVSLLLLCSPAVSLRAETSLQPDAGGVTLDVPEENKIEAGTTLSVSFPVAMAGTDKIDLAGEPCPIRFDPPVAGDWLWKSQTDGEFTVKAPITPDLKTTVRLATNLHDLTGTAVAPVDWGTELHTEPFTVKADWSESDQLESRPAVVMKFSYPVRLTEVADRIYFQDRDAGTRLPAELSLHEEDRDNEPEAAVLRATPRDPLPGGKTWDLVIENVRENVSGVPTPYLKRVPLGTAAPMTLKWIGAFNLPLEAPLLRARMDDYLDPGSVNRDSVRVEPIVPNLKVSADDDDILLTGEFDRTKHYEVTINTSARGRRGYGLAAPVRWGVTFRPMISALFFPGSTVSQRAALGLKFNFLQVHTGALRWRLAAVPLEKLALVDHRVREFESAKISPITKEAELMDNGVAIPKPTELLVDVLGLATKAEGRFPASAGEVKDVREIRWSQPGSGKGGVPAGAYLLEVDGPCWDGKGTVGQRSIVFFSESVITEKRTRDTVLARVAGMSDGLPRAGIPVRALSSSNYEVARVITDPDGLARFSYAQLHPAKNERGGEAASSLVADTPEGPSICVLDGEALDEAYVSSDAPAADEDVKVRAMMVTDRSLYRPGQGVRFKGIVRTEDIPMFEHDDTKLSVPAGAAVAWQINAGEKEETVGEGTATVDANGGWEAQWTIPSDGKLGDYRLTSSISGPASGQSESVTFHVQEYKVPLFEVNASELPSEGQDAPAACKVSANYFSGQPVAGARVSWRLRWERHDYPPSTPEDESRVASGDTLSSFLLDDTYSEHAKPASEEAEAPRTSGEAHLDAKGEITLRAEIPKNLPGARYDAQWEIAVTSADGQNVAAGHPPASLVTRQPVLLGIALDELPPSGDEPIQRGVLLRVATFDPHDHLTQTKNTRVELFRVTSKTVRENVAPSVVRYRNTPLFTRVQTFDLKDVAPDSPPIRVPRDQAGRYVAVASAPGLRQVSAAVTIDGPEPDEVPVRTQTSLEIQSEKKEYKPGDTAAFLTRSPVAGVAWVSIETDGVIDNLLITLPGNTSRIEFPVKPAYAPNAQVAIYLLRPGGGDRLPAERFGRAALIVKRPDRVLDVAPALETARVRPGDEVRGSVHITSAGRAVRDADVTVWAVDDALLVLGEWHAPELGRLFYPDRPVAVKTYSALHDFVTDIPVKSLFEKGFIIGGGGEEFGGKFVRKDFQPLAYWKTGLKTNASGDLKFAFAAPDNLTRYRVIALAQTRNGQFGEGEGSVEIAKPLVVEPSLPRFLRAGDEVELRAVARQSARDQENLAVICTTDGGLTLDPAAGNPAPVTVARDAPAVFRFRAKVPDGPASAKITMRAGTAAHDPDLGDATEVTLPILPPTILRREAEIGAVPAGGDITTLIPPEARQPGAAGHYDVAVSTSPDLPRLRALPEVLEYPHGCFEQITSRILVYSGAQDLLAGLPADSGRVDHFKQSVQKALLSCSRAVLADGRLPYWTGQNTGNAFATIQGAWAVRQAPRAGLAVDSALGEKLEGAVKKLVIDPTVPAALRAFGLMVQASPASRGGGEAEDEEEAGFDEEAARSIYLNRESLGDEGRALLAVALHFGKVMPEEKRQLLREILPLANGTRPAPERAFDPYTFGSPRRAEAVAMWALLEIHPPEWKPADVATARVRLNKMLERAPLNSTQENLWALLAFHAVRKAENAPRLRLGKVRPAPGRISPNGTAAEWTGLALGGSAASFRVPMEVAPSAGVALSCFLSAEYRVGRAEEDARKDHGGMRVERVVHNLTDPERTGRPGEMPLRINDRLLVTYRLQTPKLRSYVALEDELPAGLEAVNPDLPLFAAFYDLPPTPAGQREASLSSSELRDHTTLLYFDRLDPGVTAYSVLARVSTAGMFRWPATQAGPMYEPAISGLAPSEQIVVTGD